MQKTKVLEINPKDIIHKLRTPLIVIKVGIGAVKNYMPTLVKAYELAKKNGLDVEDIPQEKLQMLEKLLDNSEKEIHFINEYVKAFLPK